MALRNVSISKDRKTLTVEVSLTEPYEGNGEKRNWTMGGSGGYRETDIVIPGHPGVMKVTCHTLLRPPTK